jgi:hypothetical protein
MFFVIEIHLLAASRRGISMEFKYLIRTKEREIKPMRSLPASQASKDYRPESIGLNKVIKMGHSYTPP